MTQASSSEKIANDSLSNGKMALVVSAVVESFDIEIARLEQKEEELLKVNAYFDSMYHSTNLYSFFVPVSFKEVTQYIFSDPTLRMFMLNYVERVSMALKVRQLSYDDELVKMITEAVTATKIHPDSQYCLINKEVIESLYVNPEVLQSMLKDNFWLVVLYLLLVNYQLSTVFKASKAA